MKFEMIHRDYCELCHSCNKIILISRQFQEPSIANFLSKYYEGRIRITDFKDYKFEVALCNECGFIWQTNILDPIGMELLYSDWISDKMSLDKKIYADITLFKHYSEEVQ